MDRMSFLGITIRKQQYYAFKHFFAKNWPTYMASLPGIFKYM